MQHISHLQKDKKFARIISEPINELRPRKNIALTLIGSIMSQQLNTKVADIIQRRFLDLYGEMEPTLQQVLDTPVETLRTIGLSNAKANYVHNVARFFMEQKITNSKIKRMGNDEILSLFTQIKGVGQWTVEMLLMFTLGREDVVALDDLGIQQAMIKLYKLDALDKKQLRQKMIKLSSKWSPYRTYVCLYLWRWKDAK